MQDFQPLDPAAVAAMDAGKRALYDAVVTAHAATVLADAELADAQATVKELETRAGELARVRKVQPTQHDLWKQNFGRK